MAGGRGDDGSAVEGVADVDPQGRGFEKKSRRVGKETPEASLTR